MKYLRSIGLACLVGAGAISLFVVSAAAQSPSTPKLIISNLNLYSPDGDGFYTASVTVSLQPPLPNNSNVSFSLVIPHVKTIEEIREKIKPTVDEMADDAKKASKDFEPHQ